MIVITKSSSVRIDDGDNYLDDNVDEEFPRSENW